MTNPTNLRPMMIVRGMLLGLVSVLVITSCGPSGGTEPPVEGDTSVQVSITGPGRVVQGDFTCSGSCTWTGDGSEPVTLQAIPSTGNVLVSWGGVCPVLAEECTRTFTDGDDVTVTFAPHALRLDLTGDGEGLFRVAGGPVNATCDRDCGIAVDTSLQLAVTYEAGGTSGTGLGAWTGACAFASFSDDYCLVTASGATNVGKTWRHPPVATSDGYTTWRNAPLSVDAADGVLANDTDTPGDPLTATLPDGVDNGVDNGTLTLRPDGGFDYEPKDGFEGQDGFTYVVQDAFGNEATGDVAIAVVDRVPAAADDAYATTRNAVLVVDAANGVLANDVDPDGDALTAVLVDDATGGTLTLADDGGFTYAPNLDFVGTDSFTYRASDGVTTGNLATVTITIDNRVPDAAPDTYETTVDTSLVVGAPGVLINDDDPDGDALSATLVAPDDPVENGTLTFQQDGSFTYAPDPGFIGSDQFTYVADDGVDTSATTTVTIDVRNPVLTFSKTGTFNDELNGDGFADPGETIDYTFTLTNTGTVTLTSITVDDPLIDITGGPITSLAPTASDDTTFTGSYAITQDDIDAGQVQNTATADSDQGTPTTDTDTVTLPQDPDLKLQKAGSFNDENGNDLADPGETIDYTFTLTNTGTVTLTSITVDDPLIDITGGPITSLAPTASDDTTFTGSYAITQDDIDAGQVQNTATADSDQGTPTTDTDTVTLPQDPDLKLQKAGSFNDENGNDLADPGETIDYTFTLTNTGTVTLTSITVDDPLIDITGGPITSLAPTASDDTTFTGSYAITQDDIDAGQVQNTATADSDQGTPTTDTHTELLVAESTP